MNKVWLVTGSASGLGRNIAEAVLESGDRLVATARDTKRLDELVIKYGNRVRAVPLDVTDESAAEAAVQTASEDTENSLVAYSARQGQLKSRTEQAGASRRAAELAETQNREGVADFLVLLDPQRTQLDAQDSVAQAETDVNLAVVAINRALRGVGQQPADATTAMSLGRAP